MVNSVVVSPTSISLSHREYKAASLFQWDHLQQQQGLDTQWPPFMKGIPLLCYFREARTTHWLRGGAIVLSQDFLSLLEGMLTFSFPGYLYHFATMKEAVLWGIIENTQRQAEQKDEKKSSQRPDLTTPEGQDSYIVKEGKSKFRKSSYPKNFCLFFEQLFLWDIRKCLKKRRGALSRSKDSWNTSYYNSLLVIQNINTGRDFKKPYFKDKLCVQFSNSQTLTT